MLRVPANARRLGGRTLASKSDAKSDATTDSANDSLIADQTDHPGEPVAVTAAGALPWRVSKDKLEGTVSYSYMQGRDVTTTTSSTQGSSWFSSLRRRQ